MGTGDTGRDIMVAGGGNSLVDRAGKNQGYPPAGKLRGVFRIGIFGSWGNGNDSLEK